MKRNWKSWVCMLVLMGSAFCQAASAQERPGEESEFGPVVRAYLGYLRNEQEVTDDRASRHEIKRSYYIRNSNRIRALRQMAIRIARETQNDYLPELEASAGDELGNLFEKPPRTTSLRLGEVYNNTFRFLGTVRAGELYYVFARLDPYEQAELLKEEKPKPQIDHSEPATISDQTRERPRRANSP